MKRGNLFVGILIGAVLFTGSTAYAAGVMAERSNHIVKVDGAVVDMEAYLIGGNNYVKLRDIGEAVGFNVYWDDGVQVDSQSPYTGEKATSTTGAGTPIFQEGATITCDDGSTYTITDMSRYDQSAFAAGPIGALPTATCDWSSFPNVEVPKAEYRHIQNSYGDYLFVRNLGESLRMQYTLQNLAGNHPDTSENGKLRYGSKGTPYVQISLTIDEDKTPQSFWPWRESEIEKVFNSCPIGTYQMEVWDVYNNGIFQYTEYLIYAQ